MFRIKFLDAVALQTMPLQHPDRAAGDAQQTVSARIGNWSTGPSSSSGGEQCRSETRRRRLRSFGPKLNSSRMQQRGEAGSGLEEDWNWKLRRRSRTRRNWTSRGGGCRSRYVKLRNSRTWIRCSGTVRKRSGRRGYWRLR